jgi:hypothetical protein
MTQVTFPQSISKKSFLSRTGSLFTRMGRGLTKRSTIIEVICSLFIILFIYTGINKMMDYHNTKLQMQRSPFINNMAGFIAATLPTGEILLALLLIIKRTRLIGLYVSLFLMTLFTGYIWTMLTYSYDLPCSCGGIISKMSWHDHLIFNIAFTSLSVLAIVLQSTIPQRIREKSSV